MSTNRYNSIVADTKNRYNSVSSANTTKVNPAQNSFTGLITKTIKTPVVNNNIKQEAISQKGIDPALYEQLRLRGNTADAIKNKLQPESLVKIVPQAIKETLQGFNFLPAPTTPDEPFDKQPLFKKITSVAAEIPSTIKQVGGDIFKSGYGMLATPFAPAQEQVKIPFTNQTAPTFLATYNDAISSGMSPLMATILTTSRAAGDVLIVSGVANSIGKIPVKTPSIVTLTRQDLINITRGPEFAGKVDPVKLDAYKKLSQEGVDWHQALKDTGTINVKTGNIKTLADVIKEQSDIIKQDQRGVAKMPGSATGDIIKTEPVKATNDISANAAGAGELALSVKSPMVAGEEIIQKGTVGLHPDIASTIEPLQAVVEGQKQTPMSERIRAIDYLRTPWKVFDRMGIRPAYQTLLKGYNDYVHELPINIDKITAWSKRVPPESNAKIFRSLDGEDVALTTDELQVAKEIKTWLGEWADRLHMAPNGRITDYITHIFPAGKGGEIPEEIVSLIRDKTPGSIYDPFLLQRQGAKGYIQDTWKALDAYTKRATRKVNMDPALAQIKEVSTRLTESSQLDYLNKYLGAVNMRPNELDTLIDNNIKSFFGYKFGVRPTASITRNIRMMISRAKIGGSITSFAKNLTQGVNTFSDLGAIYTTRGYIDIVKFGAKELEENGVLAQPFIEDRTYSAIKTWAERFDKVLFFNMNASELINRGSAYYGAKAKFLNGKITPKEYREGLGKDSPDNYKPTMEDAVAYGKFLAGKTQFQFGALDTPVFLNSDIAKTFAQFQTFGLKQAEFIGHMANNKDWAKLIRYIVGSTLLFSTIGSAFGMKWDDSFKTMRWGMPPAIQFFADLYNSGVMGVDKYGRKLNTDERLKATGKNIFTNVVPAGAQIKRTVEGLSTVNAGKSRSESGTFQYKVKQTPANYTSSALFGKFNIPESKAYYQKQDDKLKGKKNTTSNSNRYNSL